MASVHNEIISEKETLQDTITFREPNKSKYMTVNESDMSLLQILQSLQNEDDCVSVATTPPRTVLSTAGVKNTSSEAISENKVENDRVVTKVSPSVPLGRVENDGRLKDYFCSEVVFNLSHRVLSYLEIEVLGEGLGFSLTSSFINEADPKRDFVDFSRKMRCKWHFRNDITENFSETSVFHNKSTWNPPQGHPVLEMFLGLMEVDVFSLLPGNTTRYNLTK